MTFIKQTFLAVFALLISNTSSAFWNPSISVIPDGDGLVSIPIVGGDSYWIILNECRLEMFGMTQSGQRVSYRPNQYGDIFYFQQYRGPVAAFVTEIVYLELAEVTACASESQALTERTITQFTAAMKIKDVFDRIKTYDSSLKLSDVTLRFAQVTGKTCPTNLDTHSQINQLAECIRLDELRNNVADVALRLQAVPSMQASTNFDQRRYQIRKPFAGATIKTSFAFVSNENTAVNTVFFSFRPAGLWQTPENVANQADRFSLDIGIANIVGDTASDQFRDIDQHYLFGVGYEFADNISFHAGNLISYSKEKTENNFVFGVSLDILSLISQLSK